MWFTACECRTKAYKSFSSYKCELSYKATIAGVDIIINVLKDLRKKVLTKVDVLENPPDFTTPAVVLPNSTRDR